MKVLWAPWRMQYIQSELKRDRNSCFLCEAVRDRKNPGDLVIYLSEKSFVILNKFPYNSGHLMVAPFEHISDLSELDDETMLDMMKLLRRSCNALMQAISPHGFNIGINIGRIAGAGLEEHIHIHVVPRWAGDTNFMPVLGKTKVIPEYLKKTMDKLKKFF